MVRNHPDKLFARYADDGVAHCRSKDGAAKLYESLKKRLAQRQPQLPGIRVLVQNGFREVYNLAGGVLKWPYGLK